MISMTAKKLEGDLNDSPDIEMKTETRRTVVVSLLVSVLFSTALIGGVVLYLR